MLFGSKEQQNFVLDKALGYAKDMEAKLIFGAVIGSISRGVQCADSDYDVRFLYLRKDFPGKICVPYQMAENELVKRYRTENKVLNIVPLWEATSFLHFLLEPRFTEEVSDGLYAIVGWTLQSPYVWDPYGLQNKLTPLVNKIFRKEYIISYYEKELEKYRAGLCQEMAVAREYLYAVYAAAALEWCEKGPGYPPIDMGTLLCGLGRTAVWEESKKILYQSRIEARQAMDSRISKQDFLRSARMTSLTPKNQLLLEYIDRPICAAALEDMKGKKDSWTDNPEIIVNNMYEIIYHSVLENEKLDYNWNCE